MLSDETTPRVEVAVVRRRRAGREAERDDGLALLDAGALPSGAVAQPGGAAHAQQREVLARRVADELGRPRPAVGRDAVARALVDDVRRGDHEALVGVEHPARAGGGPAVAARRPRRARRGREPLHDLRDAARRRRRRRRPARARPPRAPAPAAPSATQVARRAPRVRWSTSRPDHRPRRRVHRRRRAPRARRASTAISTPRDLQLLAAREHRLLDPPAVDEGAVGRAEVAHAQAAGRLRRAARRGGARPARRGRRGRSPARGRARTRPLRRELDGPPGVGAGQDPQPHGRRLISRRRRRPGACGA